MHLQSTCCKSGTVTKVDVALPLGADILVGRWAAGSAWGDRMGSLWWCPVVRCSHGLAHRRSDQDLGFVPVVPMEHDVLIMNETEQLLRHFLFL